MTYIQADLMGAWRGPTNVSGLVSAGARWGSVHKDLARAVGSLLDLVVGVAVLHIELYALEKVMHATASAGYVAFWVLFWM